MNENQNLFSSDDNNRRIKSNKIPTISAFPKDGNAWRLDWLGEIACPNKFLRYTQPSVLVHMSRLIVDGFGDDPKKLLAADSTFVDKQRKYWVSADTLPILAVGDIWCDGELVMRPDYEIEQFNELDVTPDTSTLIKSGLSMDGNRFLLPFAGHPWHRQCTHSYCVMVQLPGDRQMIIPCIELIRFYFGSSSNLVTKLFQFPLRRDALYSNPHFDERRGRLSLMLAESIFGSSAADIGRLHLEPKAWRAASQIGVSLQNGCKSDHGIYLQSFFPFEGKTDLVASGKWLSFGEKKRTTFVVYRLRSCSHPFPLKSLRYEMKKPSTSSSTIETNPDQRRNSSKFAGTAQKEKSDQNIVEMDASSKLASVGRTVWCENRFLDLQNKSIWKHRALSKPKHEGEISRAKREYDSSVAVGQAEPGRGVRSIDLRFKTQLKRKQGVPEFLKKTVQELKMLDDQFGINLLTESDEDGWTIPISLLSDEEGEIDQRLFVEIDQHSIRERRVAIFRVEKNSELVCIAAVEAKPVHLKLYVPPADNQMALWETLKCASGDFLSRPEPKSENVADSVNWIFTG